MEKELDGLEYEELVLDQNVHKIVGKLTKLQNGNTGDVNVDEGAMWLVTGLGYLKNDTPDNMLVESLKDTIIISKTKLIEFIKKSNE